MVRAPTIRAAIALLLAGGLAACDDELPTGVGSDLFPDGANLTSLVYEFDAAEFLETLGVFDGFFRTSSAGYGVVAHDFDGTLDARTLIRLVDFPITASVPVEGAPAVVDTIASFPSAVLIAAVDTLGSAASGPTTLRLHAAAQEWDWSTSTWEIASDTGGITVPWTTPGGALGDELARTTWTPGGSSADTIRWQVDSLAIETLRSEEFPGLIVVAEDAQSRLRMTFFELRADARPVSRPDTTVSVSVGLQAGTFIYTPEPPPAGGDWVAGGITAARTLFRMTLPGQLAGCAPGSTCAPRPIRDVAINEISLMLEPLPVPGGFRPLSPIEVGLRTIAEPELGRRAPIGPPAIGRQQPGFAPLFSEVVVAGRHFAPGAADTVVTIPLTDQFRGALAADSTAAALSTAFAILAEPEGANFGQARFRPGARLRIVYTLPVSRTSP
jgi:hypothetical protein